MAVVSLLVGARARSILCTAEAYTTADAVAAAVATSASLPPPKKQSRAWGGPGALQRH